MSLQKCIKEFIGQVNNSGIKFHIRKINSFPMLLSEQDRFKKVLDGHIKDIENVKKYEKKRSEIASKLVQYKMKLLDQSIDNNNEKDNGEEREEEEVRQEDRPLGSGTSKNQKRRRNKGKKKVVVEEATQSEDRSDEQTTGQPSPGMNQTSSPLSVVVCETDPFKDSPESKTTNNHKVNKKLLEFLQKKDQMVDNINEDTGDDLYAELEASKAFVNEIVKAKNEALPQLETVGKYDDFSSDDYAVLLALEMEENPEFFRNNIVLSTPLVEQIPKKVQQLEVPEDMTDINVGADFNIYEEF